jgi:hypothetical protein
VIIYQPLCLLFVAEADSPLLEEEEEALEFFEEALVVISFSPTAISFNITAHFAITTVDMAIVAMDAIAPAAWDNFAPKASGHTRFLPDIVSELQSTQPKDIFLGFKFGGFRWL